MKRSTCAPSLLSLTLVLAVLASREVRAQESGFNDLLSRAQLGDVAAETTVGLAYCNGSGVPRDYQQGYAWLQKAAKAHSPAAKSALGRLYEQGLGVAQDDRQAYQWYLAGANGGDPNGQDSLGEFYAAGRIVPRDEAQAAVWYGKAAAQGNLPAETHLGLAYQNGAGVAQDPQKAFTYFLQAAGHNFGPAQYHVALCYWNGVFVPRDPVKAYFWCSLAVRTYPGKEAEDLLHQLTLALTGDQLEQGDALVDDQERHGSAIAATGTFASGKSAKMHFRNVVGHIVVTATIGARANLQFLIDTGASASFLDQKTATALSIPASDTYTTGNGIGKDLLLSAATTPVSIGLPGVSFAGVSFKLFSTSSWDRPVGVHIDGIIGTDILRSYAIRLDYRRRTLVIMDPAVADVGRAGDAVPLDMQHGLILVEARLSRFNVASNPTQLIVDTGSNESITLSRNFLMANPTLKFSPGVYSYALGGGGAASETITRCAQLEFGDMVIKNPLVHIITQNQGLWANGWAGSIGNDILQRFDLTIDFPGKTLYLRPSSSLAQTDEYVAGLLLKTSGWIQKSCVASAVTAGSPAAQAGVEPGDVLVQVDGLALKGLSLEDARALLRQPMLHHVLVKRGDQSIVLAF